MTLLEPQLARTIRALELMAEMKTAHENADDLAFETANARAVDEAGFETLVLIQGGMRIGEIPMPDHPEWHRYLDDLRGRLAAETAEDEA
jgi:hypothetical protein